MRRTAFLMFLVALYGCRPVLAQARPRQSIPVLATKTPDPTPTPQVHTSGGGGGYCSFSDVTGPIRTPLMIAIWQGDLQKVTELTEANTDLNVKFPYCGSEGHATTPLINAVEGKSDEEYIRRKGINPNPNHEEVVEFLLRHGASPNLTLDGYSALHMASEFGELKIVQILLRHGANIEAGYQGETPLLMAARSAEGTAVVPELIAAGANINALDDLGYNALMIAASAHQVKTVKLFAKLGIDPCTIARKGKTALSAALYGDSRDPAQYEIITFLLDTCGRSGLVK